MGKIVSTGAKSMQLSYISSMHLSPPAPHPHPPRNRRPLHRPLSRHLPPRLPRRRLDRSPLPGTSQPPLPQPPPKRQLRPPHVRAIVGFSAVVGADDAEVVVVEFEGDIDTGGVEVEGDYVGFQE